MKLNAKIYPKYLDMILEGKKDIELRQLESITLSDGKRTHTFRIRNATIEENRGFYSSIFPDMFEYDCPVLVMELGRELKEAKK